jgi:hypothetical protein
LIHFKEKFGSRYLNLQDDKGRYLCIGTVEDLYRMISFFRLFNLDPTRNKDEYAEAMFKALIESEDRFATVKLCLENMEGNYIVTEEFEKRGKDNIKVLRVIEIEIPESDEDDEWRSEYR